jgi:hypothetical protein
MVGTVNLIDYKTAIDFVVPRHYAGRKPQITQAWGWFFNNELKAVISIGKPASATLCTGIAGPDNSQYVYELNRMVRLDDWQEPMSQFLGYILRYNKKHNPMIIVSYADTGMNHNGYIYQATNFIYTGKTKERTDKYTEGNKHSRHYSNDEQGSFRKVRTAKHRYVYFCADKRVSKQWKRALNYHVLPYPKDESKRYTLGNYQKPILVRG